MKEPKPAPPDDWRRLYLRAFLSGAIKAKDVYFIIKTRGSSLNVR